jgi:hypothetical protein
MVRELGSGRSRLETAASLGIRFQIAPNLSIEDGIHAVRMLMPRCWFDEQKCAAGIESLQHYRKRYNQALNEYSGGPVHDRWSHGADAFRYLALSLRTPVEKKKPERPRESWVYETGRGGPNLSWMR